MIVTCEQCTTQFHLDDAKVPAGGVRVRCSRCKHAFFIQPPDPGGEPEPAGPHRAARDVLDEQAPPPPDASRDLGASEPTFDDDDDIGGESDWEFNQEAPGRGDAAAGRGTRDVAREAIDDLLGSRAAIGDPAQIRSPDRGVDVSGVKAEAEPAAADESLGSPESWDFGAADPAAESAAADAEDEAPAPAPRRLVQAPASAADEWVEPSEPSSLLAWIARAGHAIGWSITLGLIAITGVAALAPGFTNERATAAGSQRLALLEAQGVRGRWVENVVAGPVFVVSGRLANPSAEPMPLGTPVGVRLLDARGTKLGGEPASVGPRIPERELRELDPAALQARQAAGARELAATSIGPGETVAFQAVVVSVPESATRFVLEPLTGGHGAPAVPAQ